MKRITTLGLALGATIAFAGVAQALEVDAFDDPPGVDVQAGDDPDRDRHPATAASASGRVNAPA